MSDAKRKGLTPLEVRAVTSKLTPVEYLRSMLDGWIAASNHYRRATTPPASRSHGGAAAGGP